MLPQQVRSVLHRNGGNRLLGFLARKDARHATAQAHRSKSSALPQVLDGEEGESWDSMYSSTVKQRKINPLFVVENEPSSPSKTEQLNGFETRISPATLTFVGGSEIPITSALRLVTPEDEKPQGTWPVYRFLDEDGHIRDPSHDGLQTFSYVEKGFRRIDKQGDDLDLFRAHLCKKYPSQASAINKSLLFRPAKIPFLDTDSRNALVRAHLHMVRLRQMDTILLNAQRQGRVSFYLTCTGEEAIHMGAASALDVHDPILAQYREQGLLMYRGFTLEQFTNQCFGNDRDLGKGRQMPIHYGSKALNYHTISSPLGTQLPQSVGVAYRLKLEKKQNVAVCFFGDGCASAVDFHSALNFASTLAAPVLFICRNNGYAISTPVTEQYTGDGIVARGPGYGVASVRVDGNDIFAVHLAVLAAKEYALKNSAPVLIECMTYRVRDHSTSDDSTSYRCKKEVEHYAEQHDPLQRFESFLIHNDWLAEEEAQTIAASERRAVLDAMSKAEKRPPPTLSTLFEDVYHAMPPSLIEQQYELNEHLSKYPLSS